MTDLQMDQARRALGEVASGDRRWAVLRGDNLEWLAQIADASIDAVVTDPPYGLSEPPDMLAVLHAWLESGQYEARGGGFMGREWDSFVPGPRTWREVYRVLKPGGHVVAFAGTRTFDLMSLSIRLAGFELRDTLQWLYGSGFPKNLDVAKAIDKRRDDREAVERVRYFLTSARYERGLTNRQVAEHFGFTPTMASHWMDHPTQPTVPTWDQWLKLKDLLGLTDFMDAEVWRLNKRKGKPGEDWEAREVVGEVEMADTSKVRAGFTSAPYNAPEDVGARRVVPLTVAYSEDAKRWDGWGTALKPGWEPILLFRKPLAGGKGVAAQVLATGTGAIHIGACRTGDEVLPAQRAGQSRIGTFEREDMTTPERVGRWPANVVLTHSPACVRVGMHWTRDDEDPGAELVPAGGLWECASDCPVAELDRQSGISKSKPGARRNHAGHMGHGGSARDVALDSPHADQGGASRFFPTFNYCAKPSRAEREAGLDHLPKRTAAEVTGRAPDSAGLTGGTDATHDQPHNGYTGRHDGAARANTHPTVKPVALMRWLVRLVTPPGGIVLDPWAGSGTTGVAVMEEVELAARFLGVELDEDGHDFAAIASGRIRHGEERARRRPTAKRKRQAVEGVAQAPLADLAKEAAVTAHKAVESAGRSSDTSAPVEAAPAAQVRGKRGIRRKRPDPRSMTYSLWGEPELWVEPIAVGAAGASAAREVAS